MEVSIMSNSPLETLTDNDLDTEGLNVPGVVFVLFTATWAAPAKKMEATLVEIAPDYRGRAVFYRCDVDESPEMAQKHSIRAMPTLLAFRNAELSEAHAGDMSREKLKIFIERFL
jgi:thioredoxin 1